MAQHNTNELFLHYVIPHAYQGVCALLECTDAEWEGLYARTTQLTTTPPFLSNTHKM